MNSPCNPRTCARMAELADALASGASSRKGVEVRVLFRAPYFRPFAGTKVVTDPVFPGLFICFLHRQRIERSVPIRKFKALINLFVREIDFRTFGENHGEVNFFASRARAPWKAHSDTRQDEIPDRAPLPCGAFFQFPVERTRNIHPHTHSFLFHLKTIS